MRKKCFLINGFFSQCNIVNICTVEHDYSGHAQNELSDFHSA